MHEKINSIKLFTFILIFNYLSNSTYFSFLHFRRKLKNRNDGKSEKNCDNKKVTLKTTVSEKRENIDSVKGAIRKFFFFMFLLL